MLIGEFEKLLKREMGLDPASIGTSAIERAVQQRLSECKLDDLHAYWDRVQTSAAELQELIEAVVVAETWFFRHQEAFPAMIRWVIEECLPTHPQSVVRLLSVPCSTGEEPYSMAMALLDAGLPPQRFQIDAVDISARAVAHAHNAVYGRNSFRGKDLNFRERHLEATAGGYRVSEAIRRQVRFRQGNLLDTGFLPGEGLYDIVFCRNVLIYFDRPTQDRTVQTLARLLAPKGVLFVGPSETGLLLDHDFVSTKVPLAFAFRRTDAIVPVPKPQSLPPWPPAAVTASPAAVTPTLKPRSVPLTTLAATPSVSRPQPTGGIEDAQQLADQGRLAEAVQVCESHLREHGPSAQGFYLIGVIRDASGSHAEAIEFYRKALYLDPHHHEALVHLALLLANQGDDAGAQLLYKRARRTQQKQRG